MNTLVVYFIFNLRNIMSKKMLFLAAGYVLGGVVSSLYNKKKPEDIKKELKAARKSGENDFSVLANNFVEIHNNLLEDIKSEVLSEKNKKLLKKKTQEVADIVESYKTAGKEVLDELQVRGKEFLTEASEKLEVIYQEKKQEISELTDLSPEQVEEIKKKLTKAYNDVKKKIK
ncbi:hypothetical protein MK079_02775 [Candidatus Gracilibacteria bacterium]|nr:hypothetical protein [Candidatus Gracilibacteria bacterium]